MALWYVQGTVMLTNALLMQLENEWVKVGAPIVGQLRPPASAESIADLERLMGGSLHPDIQVWFAWHDGASAENPLLRAIGPSGYELLSSADAVSCREDALSSAQMVAEQNDFRVDEVWDQAWMPLCRFNMGESYLAVHVETGKIFETFWSDSDKFTPVADSLEDVVRLWVSLYQRKHWLWAGNGWVRDFSHDPKAGLQRLT